MENFPSMNYYWYQNICLRWKEAKDIDQHFLLLKLTRLSNWFGGGALEILFTLNFLNFLKLEAGSSSWVLQVSFHPHFMGVQVDKLWELKHSSLAISYIHCSSDNWGFAAAVEFKKREGNSKRHMFKNIMKAFFCLFSKGTKFLKITVICIFCDLSKVSPRLPLPNFSHFKPTRLKMIESKINRQAVVTFSITKASKSLPNDGSLSISSFSPLKTSLKAPLLNTKHFLIFWSQRSYWSSSGFLYPEGQFDSGLT